MTDPEALILAHRQVEAAAKVTNMQDYKDAQKPHISLACSDAVHVVPVAYIEALIAGKLVEPLTQPMLAAILGDWLSMVLDNKREG